jgi:hypothetical protein
MQPADSHSEIMTNARARARALLAALEADTAELTPRFAEGAACCEDAARQTRRLIAELDAQLDNPKGQDRP